MARLHRKKLLVFVAIAVVLVATAISAYYYNRNNKLITDITYLDFMKLARAGKVDVIFLDGGSRINGELTDGSKFVTENPRNESFKENMLMLGIKVQEGQGNNAAMSIFRGLSILGLVILSVWFISKAMNKGVAPGNRDAVDAFSTMQCDSINDIGITFSDVAGNSEAKESVHDIVDFLKHPDKYSRMGARMPKGVIFYGPPGTGKTLLAKAVAGEAGVPYFAFSGSDFVQMYVGVGAARIRDVFKKAREKGKCVIFLDEIDALGRKRDGIGSGGNDERSQTLNALLTEMSGFNSNDGIVVIAATNRLDVLDDALLRPGRFDRQVEIGLPDVNERAEILRIHARNKPLSDEIDIDSIARQTVYFSGAQLENLFNEAAIFAAKRGSRLIEKADVEKAFYTVIAGAEKKDRSAIAKADREVTAYHEAGHALVTKLVAPENRVTKVTIIPSTRGAGGFSISLPPDRMYRRKKEMESNIKIALAGRVAEEVIFGRDNVTTGASNDIERATHMVMALVKRFGMGESTGILNYDILLQNGSGNQQEILKECERAMESYYQQTKDLLIENKFLLDKIARTLLIQETIDEECLEGILKGEGCIRPSVEGSPVKETDKSRTVATA